jgi:hypothetical protein
MKSLLAAWEGRRVSDIIDTIDALVAEQLAEGEQQCGTDPLICPHCDRDWHGFPLTEQIADMHSSGLFDEDYKVAGDDSPVLCPGSIAYGPARPEALRHRPHWVSTIEIPPGWYSAMGGDGGSGHRMYTFVIDLDPEGPPCCRD